MMIPIIKLIHDDARGIWICGDETGGLLLISDEFAADAMDVVWSKTLKAIMVSDSSNSLTVPVLDDPNVCAKYYGSEDIIPWPDEVPPPKFGEYVIDIQKGVVGGKYIIHAGFNQDAQVWAYHDGFSR